MLNIKNNETIKEELNEDENEKAILKILNLMKKKLKKIVKKKKLNNNEKNDNKSNHILYYLLLYTQNKFIREQIQKL